MIAPWARDPALVAFFESHRQHPDDLYPSERRFLPWLAGQARSVLDVGCAGGGFANIWRHFNSDLSYTGVDISEPLVESARRMHPDVEFLLGDCAEGLPLASCSSDVVQALGWLHWERRFHAALRELWRITGRWLFFDVRLIEATADLTSGEQRLMFAGLEDGGGRTPYICCSWPRFAALLEDLQPAKIIGYGYWGEPAATVTGVSEPVCFTTFVLERAGVEPSEQTSVALDAPLTPDVWSERAVLLSHRWLEETVPQC